MRSASGARISGDDYQHLVAWSWALRAIHPESNVVSFAVEALEAGSVDDVVVKKSDFPHEYLQVKFAVDATNPVNTAWLTKPQGAGGKSLLQRFYESWGKLRKSGEDLEMWLVTNRNIDPSDHLLIMKDGNSDMLIPAAGHVPDGSNAGILLDLWKDHLEIDRTRLLDMLEVLRFQTGRSFTSEMERAQALMLANGFRGDEQAVALGIGTVRGWVKKGIREFGRRDLKREIDKLKLQIAEPYEVLLVQAIDRDPNPEDAVEIIDWVDLFQGESPSERREPKDPNAWVTVMAPRLREAADRLRASGAHRVFVKGAMRLATLFIVGTEFRRVTGMEVACRQGNDVWSSDARAGLAGNLTLNEEEIGRGSELAVAIGITIDITDEVREYVRGSGLDVSHFISLTPASGANDQAIRDASQAIAFAREIITSIRKLADKFGSHVVHLFLSMPGGLALILGHRWNRVVQTIVYEDLGTGKQYIPTFIISA